MIKLKAISSGRLKRILGNNSMKILSCGIIPFKKEGAEIKFLLIKHLDGHWSFPKGKKNKGESDLDTAKRELFEETGIRELSVLEEKNFVESYSFTKDDQKFDKEVTYFLAEVFAEEVSIQEKEICEYKWLNYDDSLVVLSHDEAKNILKNAYKYVRGN